MLRAIEKLFKIEKLRVLYARDSREFEVRAKHL